MRIRATVALALTMTIAAAPGAHAVQIDDPNLSRDAAYCRDLTLKFNQAVAARANDPGLDDTRKTGARGAYLCRFERYREGIVLLERALGRLNTPAPR
jgi:hypothetical protein